MATVTNTSVLIKPESGLLVSIENIQPTISSGYIKSGDVIGQAQIIDYCSPHPFIHVSINWISPDGISYVLDPTSLLRPLQTPSTTVKANCNSYAVEYKGK